MQHLPWQERGSRQFGNSSIWNAKGQLIADNVDPDAAQFIVKLANNLIPIGRRVVKSRCDSRGELTDDYLTGFEEGVAELIGSLVGESATDILAELDFGDEVKILIDKFKAKNYSEGHLDDLVYDLAQRLNLSNLNSAESEDEQEEEIGEAESVASTINNEGIESQFRYMLENGCTVEEIIKYARL